MSSVSGWCDLASPAVDGGRRAFREGSPPLVLASDAAYAMQLATTLRSIVESNGRAWPLDVLVLADRFPEDARRTVVESLPEGSAEVRWVPVDVNGFASLARLEHISTMTFARFLIPEVIPDGVPRALYLDADLLVLGELGRLWETDLDGAVLAAVPDEMDARMKNGTTELEGLPNVRDYFNAGVLLIDLKRWREERVSERALDYLAEHPLTPYSDQDALNVACDGRWKRLDPRWNFQDHFHNSIADMTGDERPAIVHFISSLKPWKPGSFSLNASLYDGFRSRTRFSRTPLNRIRDAGNALWHRARPLLRRSALLRRCWELARGRRQQRPSGDPDAIRRRTT